METQELYPLINEQQKRPSRKKLYICIGCCFLVISLLFFLLIALLIVWFVTGSYAFDQAYGAENTGELCEKKSQGNNPSNFSNHSPCEKANQFTYEKWFVPKENWKNITFMSRDPQWIKEGGGKLYGILLFHDLSKKTPAIVVTHGYRSCATVLHALLPGGMLWHAGYNVLILDLRNHGRSDRYDFQKPVITFGSEEYKDVLGAVDYLKTHTNVTKIGVTGSSMGGATSIIAYYKDKENITAAFVGKY